MMRTDGRKKEQMRQVTLTRQYLIHPHGSVLVEFGATKVICTATVEEKVPPFLKGQGKGWVTAEYSMLPGSTGQRKSRNTKGIDGRSQEIQRLIGRTLRTVVDLNALGERTVYIDCDVIQADGGTRTASITGAYVALYDAMVKLQSEGLIHCMPIRQSVAAVSVGILKGEAYVDLCYEEDSRADVDMNLVMAESGEFIEIQGTGEEKTFSQNELMNMLSLGSQAIHELFQKQKKALGIEKTQAQKILLASNNAHKVEEIKAVLTPLGYDLISMKEAGLGHIEIDETGKTFEENAEIKAKALSLYSNLIILADDSGLEVDALKGEPGVYSARYAGEPKSDEKNNDKLLNELKNVEESQRTARFVTALYMLFPQGDTISVRGTVEGLIAQEARGENGFGYDPLFYVPCLAKTFAQMTAEEKNAMSHRGNALKKLYERLNTNANTCCE